MLKHACDGRLALNDHAGSDAPKPRYVPDELQCVAQSIATPDEDTFSIERFSSPREFLVAIATTVTIALSNHAIAYIPRGFEIASAHMLPPKICQSL